MTDTQSLIARLEALPDCPEKWMIAGALAASFMQVERDYTFRTGDGNRVCRHEKAKQAREAIDRIAALRAKGDA